MPSSASSITSAGASRGGAPVRGRRSRRAAAGAIARVARSTTVASVGVEVAPAVGAVEVDEAPGGAALAHRGAQLVPASPTARAARGSGRCARGCPLVAWESTPRRVPARGQVGVLGHVGLLVLVAVDRGRAAAVDAPGGDRGLRQRARVDAHEAVAVGVHDPADALHRLHSQRVGVEAARRQGGDVRLQRGHGGILPPAREPRGRGSTHVEVRETPESARPPHSWG